MKYRKDGRTYRLVKDKGCDGCAFDIYQGSNHCPNGSIGLPGCITLPWGSWHETLWSKIRNWRRHN